VWHGCTPTDLVLPVFYVHHRRFHVVCLCQKCDRKWTAEARNKVLKRTVLLFLIGVFMYKLPFFWRDWDSARILGVPQRLALGYGLASVLVLHLDRKTAYLGFRRHTPVILGHSELVCLPGRQRSVLAESSAVLRLDTWLFTAHPIYITGEVDGGVQVLVPF
jgi:hypothetical protein